MSPLTPLIVTVASAFFGEHAQELTLILVCTAGKAAECSDQGRTDALNIGILISTMIAIVITPRRTEPGASNAVTSVVAAVAAALLTLIKAASNKDILNFDLLATPLYIYAVGVFALAAPFVLLRDADTDWQTVLAVLIRIASATLIGAIIGFGLQYVSGGFWTGWKPSDAVNASKFVIAPSATVIGVGTWSVALLDPVLRTPQWADFRPRRRAWMCVYGAGAVIATAGFGLLFTPPVFGQNGAVWGAIWVPALMLPGLIALSLFRLFTALPPLMCNLGASLVALLLGAAVAIAVRLIYASSTPEIWDHPIVFVLSHAFAAVGVVLVTVIVPLLPRPDSPRSASSPGLPSGAA